MGIPGHLTSGIVEVTRPTLSALPGDVSKGIVPIVEIVTGLVLSPARDLETMSASIMN